VASSSSQWKNKDKDDLRAHYEEVGEESRLYDRLIWEIPSVAMAIVGAFIAVAYGYIFNLWVRLVLLILAALWLFMVLVVSTRHMFFVDRQKMRLIDIEENSFEISSLQRFSKRKGKELGVRIDHWQDPLGVLRGQSAHLWLKRVLWATLLSMILLVFHTIYILIRN